MSSATPEARADARRANETVRVTSTARRISRAWFWRLAGIFFRMNLLLLVLAVLGFCYAQERRALGPDWEIGIERSVEVPALEPGASPWALWQKIENLFDCAQGATYIFYGPDGARYAAPCGDFVRVLAPALGALLLIEFLFILGQLFSGRRMARRLLRPLDRMARAARELGKSATRASAPQPNVNLHDLEDAISRISPDRPEEKLNMGDSDLAGLQDAINGLLSRMHEAYRQQAQFVSDASHELRTPIAVVQGYAGMLDRWGKQDEKILDESIAAIKSEAAYMNKLVEQLLFLARGDTGRNRMEPKPMDLGELMRDVYEDCLLIDRAHDWRIEAAPGVKLVGDWDLLKQCARILTDNALKYTPEGGVIILRALNAGPGEVHMEVQDSGIGIASEDMQRVFDRFYRSDPARGRASGGTGLGLSIARWIVEAHGGHFELLSREGIGTRMTVCLPAAPLSGEKD